MQVKLAVFGLVLVGVGLGLYAALKTGQDVHWDLRQSHLDKDIAWPRDDTTDLCAHERGAIHSAIIDLPGLPQIKTTPLLFVDCQRNGNALCKLDLCQAAVTRDEVVIQARSFEQLFHWAKNPIENWVKAEEKQFGSGGLMTIQRADWFKNERPLEVWATIVNNSKAQSARPYSLMITIWWRNDDPTNAGERDPSQEDAGLRALGAIQQQHAPSTRPTTAP